jgi:endonuclease/exonuclease/phosphatase family metal-dependent hydrolase
MAFYYDFETYTRNHPASGANDGPMNVARTAANLIDLRAMLDDPESDNFVPPRATYERLLIATWNIQSFGASQRTGESFWYIAEILSRFDIIAVQEVKRSLAELDQVRALLGPWWKYLVSDATEGEGGNDERLAFLYDTRKLRFGGMAGEMVLEPVISAQGAEIPARQIVRTPYIAGFRSGWFNFMLATVHIIWDEAEADHRPRVDEIRQIAQFLADRLTQSGVWARNLFLLGDFNIFDETGLAVTALTDAGFRIPHGRADLSATNVGQDPRYYDQIAYRFADRPSLAPNRIGVVDFFEAVYSDAKFEAYRDELRTADGAVPANPRSYYRNHWRRRQMSDHLVLWAELPIDFGGAYLSSRAE